eukprot:463459_1
MKYVKPKESKRYGNIKKWFILFILLITLCFSMTFIQIAKFNYVYEDKITFNNDTFDFPMTTHSFAITYLVKQRQNPNHKISENKSFALLYKSMDCLFNYFLKHNIKQYSNMIDILIFHTGDFTTDEFKYMTNKYGEYSINIYSLNINKSNNKYWGYIPKIRATNNNNTMDTVLQDINYKFMILFWTKHIWDIMYDLNYEYILRLDDDSFIL